MPEPEPQERRIHHLDARSLRGLAHPLRMQLLNALRRHGPATASMLAERLGESSGATSYHLRQLATHGFVEDTPERGKGRERWWQAAQDGVGFDENLFLDTDPAVRGAADTFLHEVATTHARELSTAIGTREDWLPKWSHSTDMSDWTVRLTPEHTRELVGKIHELLENYADDDAPEAERVRFHLHAFPIESE
ncbi:ArsR/SmtB family transcription factor [Streptomyces prunicolor]|jgi:DNA-binding transcriptional ArsR family regulator|uniref:Helix-turn-helix domain-containing protein n=1 Tax=Streptomyces prunicolor TaxID=67348 RepID=A0ABU4FK74_9ACTN|nr:helix-turn-helix domain-containing protein [Streptomyces prunicolor]MCX5234608.1 helix-turn-helix domain-containing protein [Streptomyces prunicolor]MDV7220944.1 helix-turn-helix domain-containing protein [Streptomyces prunicolor]